MAHEISLGSDGILRLAFIGDVDKTDIQLFLKDLQPFLDAATEQAPLHCIVYADKVGNYSTAARRTFSQLNADPRVGLAAIIRANRVTRVLAQIVSKATNKDNLKNFFNENEAILWIKNTI